MIKHFNGGICFAFPYGVCVFWGFTAPEEKEITNYIIELGTNTNLKYLPSEEFEFLNEFSFNVYIYIYIIYVYR